MRCDERADELYGGYVSDKAKISICSVMVNECLEYHEELLWMVDAGLWHQSDKGRA